MAKPTSSLLLWFKRLLLGAVGLAGLGVAAGAFTYAWYARDLPDVEALKTWRPPQGTKVTCRGGAQCAEFFKERRTWVDVRTLPAHVKNSFLAAEDADFYRHPGIDFWGMVRAAGRVLLGGRATGASTISQQACRNILLTRERSFARKVREWILTPRMEKALSKDEILNLYVNTIYFGQQRYGLEEAALFYFGKHAKELSLGEAAVLGGTPQLPHLINPVTNIVRAKKRQRYVLTQLKEKGFEKAERVDAELEAPIVLGPRPPSPVGQSYVEEIRKTLVARYGEQAVLEGGLRVQIAMDVKLQAAAEAAVRAGLEAVDRRQGYRGPVGTLGLERYAKLLPLLEQRLQEAGKRRPDDVLLLDLRGLEAAEPEALDEAVDPDELVDDQPAASDDERQIRALNARAVQENTPVVALVAAVDDAKGVAELALVGRKATLSLASVGWARRRSPEGKLSGSPTRISEVVQAGELVRVKLTVGKDGALEAALAQVPLVQGALVAIEPSDRTVVALVGGYDFATSAFNRATQAKRQPGSSFKPFVYGAALATGKFTALTMVNDAPEAIRDPYTGQTWKPHNFEKGGFDGPISLRTALTRSKNTVSVRLIEAVGLEGVVDFARKAGISSELPQSLTLALGSGEVHVLELANAYATLQAGGRAAEPVMLVQVADNKGVVLEEHHAAFEETLPPAVAYLTTSLMRSVVEEGTATAVRELERPAAGKTGTASEYRDAWFSGYTADLVATAWVGFDDHAPLGPGETGGKAALPVWLDFMRAAQLGKPVRDFPAPPGIALVRVDPLSGLLAGKNVPGRLEPFLEGTQPTAEAPPPGTVDANDFMLHDSSARGL